MIPGKDAYASSSNFKPPSLSEKGGTASTQCSSTYFEPFDGPYIVEEYGCGGVGSATLHHISSSTNTEGLDYLKDPNHSDSVVKKRHNQSAEHCT